MLRVVLLAVAALALMLVLATSSQAKTCGYTSDGWTITGNRVTTCQFARATVRAAERSCFKQGCRLFPYSRALGAVVPMRCYALSRKHLLCYGGDNAKVGMRHG